jgi:hypothetical protein
VTKNTGARCERALLTKMVEPGRVTPTGPRWLFRAGKKRPTLTPPGPSTTEDGVSQLGKMPPDNAPVALRQVGNLWFATNQGERRYFRLGRRRWESRAAG